MEKPNSDLYSSSPLLLSSLRERCLRHSNGASAPAKTAAKVGVPAVVFAPLVLPSWEAPLTDARMLFIKRATSLRKHAGQVGFPGGVVDADDASLLDAGFREASEEVALSRSAVEVLCALPSEHVPSGYHLYPYFVATDQQEFTIQQSEVQSVHLIPLTDLLRCPFRLEHKEWQSKVYRVVYFDLDDLCVWGITGRILEHLLATYFAWEPPGGPPP